MKEQLEEWYYLPLRTRTAQVTVQVEMVGQALRVAGLVLREVERKEIGMVAEAL